MSDKDARKLIENSFITESSSVLIKDNKGGENERKRNNGSGR
jgi:hypothetical protein